jgi:hypothetical protein
MIETMEQLVDFVKVRIDNQSSALSTAFQNY